MTEKRVERLLRKPERPREISFLELFFDLAIIFSLTQLTRRLLEDFSADNSVQTLILLAAVWWIWVAASRTADWLNPHEPALQWIISVLMFVGLLAAAAVPRAFDGHGLVFASAYVLSHVGRHLAIMYVLRGHPLQTRSARAAIWFAGGGVPWLVGAFLPAPWRLVCWSVAIVVDYVGAGLGWPVPGLGNVREHLRVTGDHIAERHRQVFIVGLGELILASGIAYSQSRLDWGRTLAFAITFANAVLMLWIYFLPRDVDLARTLNSRPPHVAIFASYAHGLMIAGIVVTAMGDEVLIGHPLGEPRAAWPAAVIAGAFVYLAGRTVYALIVFRQPAWRAPGGMLVLAAAAPGLLALPTLAVAVVVNLVLFAVVLAYRRIRRRARLRVS
ncbi:low temperature requirement protein A [Micromonospora sp. NPDC049559]|uniref:low temperature requirement protein A n=1 Tax=Micromonospora sp. NPDC049559 TaxID=3155923 RepID=UPI003447CFC2